MINISYKYIIIIIIIIIFFFSIYTNLKELFSNNGIYTAVIVEPREHKALEFVLVNFLTLLDERFNFIIFHGTKNETYLDNILNSKLKNHLHRITKINLNVDNLQIYEYNNLLVNKEMFYDKIPTEYFLIFQTDTIICSKNKDYIYDFINKNYDYVGAPWAHINNLVGNGGLSLRKKSKMLEIIKKINYENQNEDIYFSFGCYALNCNMPSMEEAKKFSVESIYSDDTFGIHSAWKLLNESDIAVINNNCDGLNELIKLNK